MVRPPSSKVEPGGNTGEVKGGEEMNWPPYLTMPAAQDKCVPPTGTPPTYGNVHGTHRCLFTSVLLLRCNMLKWHPILLAERQVNVFSFDTDR